MTDPSNPLPTPPSSLRDWRGNPYKSGSHILYPFQMGRSCFMAEGVVESIQFVGTEHQQWLRDFKRTGKTPARKINLKVMVRVVNRNSRYKPDKNVVAITRLDNITVIP